MPKLFKGLNWIVGGIRMFVAGFFATIFVLIIFPTVVGLAEVLSYGIWMFTHIEFYQLLVLLTAMFGAASLVSKAVIPNITPGE